MSGTLVGELILWLIVAIVVIAIVVYIVNWLYHRSSKEVSFVRTGLLGERVVINGGAFVLPFIHDYHARQHERAADGHRARQARRGDHPRPHAHRHRGRLLCPRRRPTREAVAIAAATLGRRTLEPEQLHALLSGKFVSAHALGRRRDDHGADARAARRLCRAASRPPPPRRWPRTALSWSRSPSPISTRPTSNIFNPSNRFDAEGLTRLMEDIEAKRKLRNDIEQDSMIKIRTRNLEAERQALDIERESETARLEQERDIEMRRALQRTEVARERALRETEAEQAQISAREAIEKARIANEQAIAEARIASERETRHSEIERTRAVEEKEIAGPRGDRKGARSPISARSTPPVSPPSARCASATSSGPRRSRKPRSRRAKRSRRRVSSRIAR